MQKERYNEIGAIILDASITVHRELGPGLLESAYEIALSRELQIRKLSVKKQVTVEFIYKEVDLGKVYIMDMLVEDEIILEIKATDMYHPIFDAQLITYLKLAGKKLGYVINFNVPLLKNGFKRIVYNF